ncbi:hypothetical protein CFC21_018305 [Triticum aestivum]|uniref:Uncharacterized protein n=2 Tax=Triticum aestivum TaxID=4565 RepID=A0A9R1E3M2_WHEAT|nr:hypothetical protein CFC21_018305 [Triticum aestivum]
MRVRVGDVPTARGPRLVRGAPPLVPRHRCLPAAGGLRAARRRQVVHGRLVARRARQGPRVEGVRRVVGAPVPVEERPRRHLHLPRRGHPPRHQHGEPPRHRHRPPVRPVVADGLLHYPRRVQPHGPAEQPPHRRRPRGRVGEQRLHHVQVVQRHDRRHRVRRQEAQQVPVHVVLVEPRVLGERHPQLRHARLDPVVAAVERRVAADAAVLNPRERLRQRPADGEAAAAVRHPVGEVDVLQVALGEGADVVGLAVVELVEDGEQVVREEDGVVVAHDEPAHAGEAEAEGLGDDAGDADGGAVAAPVRVGEGGGVGGDLDGREPRPRRRHVGLPHLAVQPDVAAHGAARAPPHLDVLLALVPEPRRGRDAEHHVLQRRRRGRRGGGLTVGHRRSGAVGGDAGGDRGGVRRAGRGGRGGGGGEEEVERVEEVEGGEGEEEQEEEAEEGAGGGLLAAAAAAAPLHSWRRGCSLPPPCPASQCLFLGGRAGYADRDWYRGVGFWRVRFGKEIYKGGSRGQQPRECARSPIPSACCSASGSQSHSLRLF